MPKKKLGICLQEENYYEEEIIKTQDDIEEPIEVTSKVSNKNSTKELFEYSDEEPIEVIDKYQMKNQLKN